MRPELRTALLIVLVAVLVAAAGTSTGRPQAAQAAQAAGVPGCSNATAGGPRLGSARPTFTDVGGEPFGVATARGYAFVANVSNGVDVLADRGSAPHLIHRIGLRQQGVGMAITPDHRYLLIADGADGVDVVDVARAEAGQQNAVLGQMDWSSRQYGGAIEVAVSRDGRYVFVSIEGNRRIAVYHLAAALADHFSRPGYVGAIPTGEAPVGLAVSPDGRWLYSTSEDGGPPSGPAVGGDGSLSMISVATAERDPAHSVVASVAAGCQPVRVAVSPDGADVWVTARGSDELLAFSSKRLMAHAGDALLAGVRVGAAPVGLAVVDGGARIVVADSDRFDASGAKSGLTIVNTASALAHRSAIVGTVNAEQFPRDMAVEPAGTVVLVSNFGSGTLEAVHISDHAQESRN